MGSDPPKSRNFSNKQLRETLPRQASCAARGCGLPREKLADLGDCLEKNWLTASGKIGARLRLASRKIG